MTPVGSLIENMLEQYTGFKPTDLQVPPYHLCTGPAANMQGRTPDGVPVSVAWRHMYILARVWQTKDDAAPLLRPSLVGPYTAKWMTEEEVDNLGTGDYPFLPVIKLTFQVRADAARNAAAARPGPVAHDTPFTPQTFATHDVAPHQGLAPPPALATPHSFGPPRYHVDAEIQGGSQSMTNPQPYLASQALTLSQAQSTPQNFVFLQPRTGTHRGTARRSRGARRARASGRAVTAHPGTTRAITEQTRAAGHTDGPYYGTTKNKVPRYEQAQREEAHLLLDFHAEAIRQETVRQEAASQESSHRGTIQHEATLETTARQVDLCESEISHNPQAAHDSVVDARILSERSTGQEASAQTKAAQYNEGARKDSALQEDVVLQDGDPGHAKAREANATRPRSASQAAWQDEARRVAATQRTVSSESELTAADIAAIQLLLSMGK